MKFHPYSEIFPLIEGAEFDALVADIKAHGLREKIWMFEGKILDGRNRFLACQKAKVRPLTRKFTGKDAKAFVISANIHRRHLSESQRAMAAAKLTGLPHGGDRRSDQAANLPVETQASAAEKLKVSERSVRSAKQVLDKGSKALRDAVEAGEVPISKAAAVVDLPKSEQLAAATAKAEKAPESELDLMPEPENLSAEEIAEIDAEVERERAELAEKVMAADDRIAAADAEVQRLARDLANMTRHRDHWMNQAGANAKFAKSLQRKLDRSNKQLEQAQAEIEKLRERVSIMQEAA